MSFNPWKVDKRLSNIELVRRLGENVGDLQLLDIMQTGARYGQAMALLDEIERRLNPQPTPKPPRGKR